MTDKLANDSMMTSSDVDWAWSPYRPSDDVPWNHAAAAHLYRRAGFGADIELLDIAVRRSPQDVVAELVDLNSEPSDFRDTADALANTILANGDAKTLSAAWVYRLLFTPHQLLEKTTLFWHGHFATGAEKVDDARMMWSQNQLLRDRALGDFSRLTQEIAKDPAMLIYLDSATNRKTHPNENFARELMELFCLGEGNYSEKDVQELARCFTGWEIRNERFRKNKYQQDQGEKTVLGRRGEFDGEAAIRIVLEQPSCPRFLARKWYRFFVADQPDPPDAFLKPLADCFRENELRTAPALRLLFGSNLFFSSQAVARKIKSPSELVVGMLRGLRGTTNTKLVADGLLSIGQGLFFPPNVKGWDGGRAWINSATLLGRANLMAKILKDSTTRFGGGSLVDYLNRHQASRGTDAVRHFERTLFAVPLDDNARQDLLGVLNSADGDEEAKMRSMLHAMTTLPQFHLG